MVIFIIILLVILIIALSIFFLASQFSNRVIYPIKDSYEDIEEDLKKRLNYSTDSYTSPMNTSFEEIYHKSNYGYSIYSRLFMNKKNSNKFVILLHRESRNLIASYKFLKLYLDEGYNVVMFDARYHGKSGGLNYTYGYFEKWDLKNIVEYLEGRFGKDIVIGLHGESGGAATALLYLQIDKNIKFAISDTSFTDLLSVIKLLEKKYLHTKSEKLLLLINQIIKRKAGFSINDVSPLFEIQALEVPVLFIHSQNDSIVPLKMSKTLQSFMSGYNDLFIGENSEHLLSYYDHKEEYENKVREFTRLATNDKN